MRLATAALACLLWPLNGCQNGNATQVTPAVATPATPAPNITPATVPATSGAAATAGDTPTSDTSTAGTSSSVSSDTTANKPGKRAAFDGDAAYALLKKQCDFGPRPLGSEAHEKCKTLLMEEMKKYADVTIAQTFSYRGLPVTNVIGVIYPAGSNAPAQNPVLLMTHWDSRPIADGPNSSEASKSPAYAYGPKGWNRTNPIPAANDGASGAGVLLILAKMFKAKKPPVGVLLILDDGEDYGDFNANGGEGEGVELGSRYFAKHFQEDKRFGYPDYGILLDMIGGKNLLLPREENSIKAAPGTFTKIYQAAQSLGYGSVFRSDLGFNVNDDHIALIAAGIRTVDLIPFFGNSAPPGISYYPYWHTLQDTPDKCSAASLKIVGETVAEVIYNETASP